MTEKSEALRLADALTVQVEIGGGDLAELEQAAAELRRLHAVNQELLEALKALCTHAPRSSQQIDADWDKARAAIAKAEGEKT